MIETRKTRNAGRGKRISGSRMAAAQSQRNAKAQASNPKRGRAGGTADPQMNYKRYMELARVAASAGDAVQSEYYHQYADHYRRLMAEG